MDTINERRSPIETSRFTGFDDVVESKIQPIPFHPLPWTQHTFLIEDANGREVLHLGGMYQGRREPEAVVKLVEFIVDSANARWRE